MKRLYCIFNGVDIDDIYAEDLMRALYEAGYSHTDLWRYFAYNHKVYNCDKALYEKYCAK